MYTVNPSQGQTRLAVILVIFKVSLTLAIPDVWLAAMMVFLTLSLNTNSEQYLKLPELQLKSYGHRTRQLTFITSYGNVADHAIRHMSIAVPGIAHLELRIDGGRSNLFDLLGLKEDCCSTGFSLGKITYFVFFKTQLTHTMGLYWNIDIPVLLSKAYRQNNRIAKEVALVELEVNHQTLQLDVTQQEIETVVGFYKKKETVTQIIVLNKPALNFKLNGAHNLAQSVIALKSNLAVK